MDHYEVIVVLVALNAVLITLSLVYLITRTQPGVLWAHNDSGGEPAWSFLARHPELRANFLTNAAAVWPRLRRAVEEAVR